MTSALHRRIANTVKYDLKLLNVGMQMQLGSMKTVNASIRSRLYVKQTDLNTIQRHFLYLHNIKIYRLLQ